MAYCVFEENSKNICSKESVCSDSSIFGQLYILENFFFVELEINDCKSNITSLRPNPYTFSEHFREEILSMFS